MASKQSEATAHAILRDSVRRNLDSVHGMIRGDTYGTILHGKLIAAELIIDQVALELARRANATKSHRKEQK